ncbi:MAG: type I-U CRISPR-associated RAMP protein Csb1/Cas7u [Candidatus Hydrogenedentota bacterium]
MAEPLTFDTLQAAVSGTAAAFRCRTTLQPAGGEGTKVFPPTYAENKYAVEQRRLPGREEPVTCVLLDSVQSQANRMEAALQNAVDEGFIELPLIEVDFSEANKSLIKPIDDRITSLTAPHRLADAILRDSEVTKDGENHGKLFRDSSHAERWRRASTANATPIYELCPTALIFGIWGAPEKPGGLGAKFQRCITSEIVAIDAVANETRQGLRRDPLGITRNASVVVEGDNVWKNASEKAKNLKRPSEVNHGPILFGPSHSGVTFREAEQTLVLTLAGLRWLRFPPLDEKWRPSEQQKARDEAARLVLSALALTGAALASESGYDLRSGCLLYGGRPPIWELLDGSTGNNVQFEVTGEMAATLLQQAVQTAKDAGIVWRSEPLTLRPSDELVKLIRRSQELAKQEGGEEA